MSERASVWEVKCEVLVSELREKWEKYSWCLHDKGEETWHIRPATSSRYNAISSYTCP